MEGIQDGRAVDSCFFCALLYPELDTCSRCGKRLRYLPARMMSAEELQVRCAALVAAFRAAPSPEKAQALLLLLHQFGDEAGIPGRGDFPSIASLRRAFSAAP
jgi:hypothetical protein